MDLSIAGGALSLGGCSFGRSSGAVRHGFIVVLVLSTNVYYPTYSWRLPCFAGKCLAPTFVYLLLFSDHGKPSRVVKCCILLNHVAELGAFSVRQTCAVPCSRECRAVSRLVRFTIDESISSVFRPPTLSWVNSWHIGSGQCLSASV